MPEETNRLVDRLQRHIDRIEQVQTLVHNAELQDALVDLRSEVDDLKIVAPHIYGPPPPPPPWKGRR